LFLGLVGLAALPAAIEASRRSREIDLLDAAWAIPVTLVLCLVAFVMARRARENLRWIRLRGGGTGVASTAVIIGALGVCLAVMAALSVGFYELVVLYQESR
jgi:hypothetical protein